MGYTDTPDSSLAKLTNGGRSYYARMIMGDVSFKLVGFDVGHDGYITSNPVKIAPINQSSTSLDSKFYPTTGIQFFEGSIQYPHPKTAVLNCRLGHSDPQNVGAIGEIGIWGEVVSSTVPAEVGTRFLYAIAHTPILVKNLQNVFVYRILVQH